MGSMKLTINLFILFSFCSATVVERYVRLNSGKDCPMVGLGTGGLKTTKSKEKAEDVRKMVRTAIENGYRHIDTGAAYGNEKAVGRAISELIGEGVVQREDLFITTKIFPNFQKGPSGRSRTQKSIRLALQKLNTSYVDLMLVHFATPDPSANANVWFALEEALTQKIVRSIGVSNYNTTDLKSLMKKAKVMPAMVQTESHPKRNQRKLIDFCDKYGIRVTAYSPLGSGSLLNDPIIIEMGENHNKTAAQVMIRWQIQRGVVAIPKSANEVSIRENIDVFDFSLTEDEMKSLENLK